MPWRPSRCTYRRCCNESGPATAPRWGTCCSTTGMYRGLMRSRQPDGLQARVDHSDIVQETMLRVAQNIGEFQGTNEEEWRAWLARIAENEVVHRSGTTPGPPAGRSGGNCRRPGPPTGCRGWKTGWPARKPRPARRPNGTSGPTRWPSPGPSARGLPPRAGVAAPGRPGVRRRRGTDGPVGGGGAGVVDSGPEEAPRRAGPRQPATGRGVMSDEPTRELELGKS